MARKTTSISFRDITRPIVRLCGMALLGAALVQATVSPAAAAQDKPVLTDRMLDGRMESSYLPAKGSSLKWGRATALVNAPLKDIMAVIENYGDYTEFLPNCKVSRVLSQRGASALIYLKISSLHGAASILGRAQGAPQEERGRFEDYRGQDAEGQHRHLWRALGSHTAQRLAIAGDISAVGRPRHAGAIKHDQLRKSEKCAQDHSRPACPDGAQGPCGAEQALAKPYWGAPRIVGGGLPLARGLHSCLESRNTRESRGCTCPRTP